MSQAGAAAWDAPEVAAHVQALVVAIQHVHGAALQPRLPIQFAQQQHRACRAGAGRASATQPASVWVQASAWWTRRRAAVRCGAPWCCDRTASRQGVRRDSPKTCCVKNMLTSGSHADAASCSDGHTRAAALRGTAQACEERPQQQPLGFAHLSRGRRDPAHRPAARPPCRRPPTLAAAHHPLPALPLCPAR